MLKVNIYIKLTAAKRREFSGMIHWLTINNHPSNPQQPIHSLRLAPVSYCITMENHRFQWENPRFLNGHFQ